MASGQKKKPVRPATKSKAPTETKTTPQQNEVRKSSRDRSNTRSARELLGMSPSRAIATPAKSAAKSPKVLATPKKEIEQKPKPTPKKTIEPKSAKAVKEVEPVVTPVRERSTRGKAVDKQDEAPTKKPEEVPKQMKNPAEVTPRKPEATPRNSEVTPRKTRGMSEKCAEEQMPMEEEKNGEPDPEGDKRNDKPKFEPAVTRKSARLGSDEEKEELHVEIKIPEVSKVKPLKATSDDASRNVVSRSAQPHIVKSMPAPIVPVGSRKRKPSAPSCSPMKDVKSAKIDEEEEREETEVQIVYRDVPSRAKRKEEVMETTTEDAEAKADAGKTEEIDIQKLLEMGQVIQVSSDSDHQLAYEALSQLAAGRREFKGQTIVLESGEGSSSLEGVEIILQQISEHEQTEGGTIVSTTEVASTEEVTTGADRQSTDVLEWFVEGNMIGVESKDQSGERQPGVLKYVKRGKPEDGEEDVMIFVPSKNARAKQTKTLVVSESLKQLVVKLEPDDDFANHVQVAHEMSGKKRMFCVHCEELIENRHHFRRHILTHPEVSYKPWKCPVCLYRAPIRAQIVRHINIHSEVKPYTCSECGKGFNFKQKLALHMKYHMDIRDFHCTECELSFHEHKTLKNHMAKIHNIYKVPKKAFRPEKRAVTTEAQKAAQGLQKDDSSAEDESADKSQDKVLTYKPAQKVIIMHPGGEQEVRFLSNESDDVEQEQRIVVLSEEAENGKTISEEKSAESEVTVTEEVASHEDGEVVEVQITTGEEESVGETDMPLQIHISSARSLKKISNEEMVGEESAPKSDSEEHNPGSPEKSDAVKGYYTRRRSNCYGTRKTEMYTEQFKMGLVGMANRNDEPSPRLYKPTKPKSPAAEEAQEAGDHGFDGEGGEPEPAEEADQEVDTEPEDEERVLKKFTHEEGDIKTTKNVPRCYTDDQLDPDLKPYCKVEQQSETKALFYCQVQSCVDECVSFSSKTGFVQHLEVTHPDIKAWKCSFCDYKCRLRSSIIAHEQMHAGLRNFTCTICSKSFVFKQKLHNHMKHHLNLREFECSACGKAFNERPELNRHMKRVHDRGMEMECTLCDKVLRDVAGLRRHMETHASDSGRHQCTYCKKYYKSRGSLAQHMKGHTCMFHCEICDKTFGSYSGFMAHKVMHDESYSGFTCEICQKVLHTKGSLTRHMLVFHSDNRPFSCKLCSKSFKTKKDLKNHDIVHVDSRLFKCGTCSFQCKRLESLRVHMRRHAEVKPFQCGKCGKEYTQKRALEQHMRHHSHMEFPNYGQKKHATFQERVATVAGDGSGDGTDKALTVFMCEECNSVFLNQDTLAVHILAEHMPKETTLSADQIKGSMLEQQNAFVEGVDVSQPVTIHGAEEEVEQVETLVPISDVGGRKRMVSLIVPQRTSTAPVQQSDVIEEAVDVEDRTLTTKAGSAMISGMDTADEQFVSITDPTTNQEMMVPVSQANLGPFESLLAATEAADQSEEQHGEGVSYVTFSADGTPMEYEEPSGANVIAIAEESVVETVEIPLQV